MQVRGVLIMTLQEVLFFSADNSSSSHADKNKNNFLMLGECLTFGINGSFGLPGKNLRINFSKASAKLCFSLNYNVDNS